MEGPQDYRDWGLGLVSRAFLSKHLLLDRKKEPRLKTRAKEETLGCGVNRVAVPQMRG